MAASSLFNKASLFLVPSGYKAGKLYPQKPTDGSGDLDVTRATTAYRTNQSGILESVANNVPRLDYPASGGCPALLVEPAATNLLLRSEEFDNASWAKTNSIVTANAFLAPNNTTTADLHIPNNATDGVIAQSFISFVSGTTYTISIYARREVFNFLLIAFPSSAFPASNRIGLFNLLNGTIATASQSGINARIQNAGNDYYRCSISITATSSASGNVAIGARSSDSLTSLGNGTNGVYLWGAQLETGSVATSYIPTVSTTQTRNADVISKTGVSALIGQTQGTLYAEVQISAFTNAGIFLSASDGTTNNRIQIYKFTDGKIYADRIAATQSGLTSISTSALSAGIYKVAFAYQSGNSALFINGSQIGSNATQTFTFGTMGNINIGSRFDNTQVFNDRIRAAAIYTERLPNAELSALTTL